jgi:hypothetical protein
MNVFKRPYLWLRMTRRYGAYKYAKEHGYSEDSALAYMNYHFPPTADDIAYGQELQLKELRRRGKTRKSN